MSASVEHRHRRALAQPRARSTPVTPASHTTPTSSTKRPRRRTFSARARPRLAATARSSASTRMPGYCRCANDNPRDLRPAVRGRRQRLRRRPLATAFGVPLALSSGNAPACVVNRFREDLVGTANVDLGSGETAVAWRRSSTSASARSSRARLAAEPAPHRQATWRSAARSTFSLQRGPGHRRRRVRELLTRHRTTETAAERVAVASQQRSNLRRRLSPRDSRLRAAPHTASTASRSGVNVSGAGTRKSTSISRRASSRCLPCSRVGRAARSTAVQPLRAETLRSRAGPTPTARPRPQAPARTQQSDPAAEQLRDGPSLQRCRRWRGCL